MLLRRGMGSPVVYGPTDAQLGICAPNDMACVLGVASGAQVQTAIGATPVGSTFAAGSMPDQVNTCVNAGGPLTDCVAAVLSTNATASGLPSWALPVGIGVIGLLLVKAFAK